MNILVTGGTGFIGTNLVNELEKRNHNVLVTDINHSKLKNYKRIDVSNYRQLNEIFKNGYEFDMVYHLAAEYGRWNGEAHYENLWKTNVIGTKHLLRIQEREKFKMVFFSSAEVYGDYGEVMDEKVMIDEPISQTYQMNDYAISKWANEMQIRNSRIMNDSQTVIVRLFNTYGPGEFYHPYRSVNCKFCYHSLFNLPITVYRGHYRSSTYVDDCVKTVGNIIDNFISGSVYNIGSDQFHDIETLANMIWDYTGADRDLINYSESELLTTKIKKLDNSLSVRDLNHKESVSLEQGVKNTIDWMKDYYRL